MVKFGLKTTQTLGIGLKKFRGEAGQVIAGKVITAFFELLYATPQRYGSYVAAWRLSIGSRGSNGFEQWPITAPESWYVAGNGSGISSAVAANAGFSEKLAGYFLTAKTVFPSISISNSTPYAEKVERGPIRPANIAAGGQVHAFENFKELLSARIAAPTTQGSAQWMHYANTRI